MGARGEMIIGCFLEYNKQENINKNLQGATFWYSPFKV
jgi:hypothetical protein